jgi:hypothetical protein
LDLIISTYTLMVKTAPGSVRLGQIGGRRAIFQGMDETKVDKLARLSGRHSPKVISALEISTRGRFRSDQQSSPSCSSSKAKIE